LNTVFLKQFYKDLDKIKDQNVKDCIAKIITNVEEANSLRDIKNLKKLKGYKTVFRIKSATHQRCRPGGIRLIRVLFLVFHPSTLLRACL